MRVDRAIAALSSVYLGQFGIVTIADRHTAAGPSILVSSTDPDVARLHVPALFDGLPVYVERVAGVRLEGR